MTKEPAKITIKDTGKSIRHPGTGVMIIEEPHQEARFERHYYETDDPAIAAFLDKHGRGVDPKRVTDETDGELDPKEWLTYKEFQSHGFNAGMIRELCTGPKPKVLAIERSGVKMYRMSDIATLISDRETARENARAAKVEV